MDIGDGKKLTCLGDEPYSPFEKEYVQNSDWLLHEAFCHYSQRDIFDPYEKNHSTVKDTYKLAEKLDVKNLTLSHRRYKPRSKKRIVSERRSTRIQRSLL